VELVAVLEIDGDVEDFAELFDSEEAATLGGGRGGFVAT
jgi:hypothetical protein